MNYEDSGRERALSLTFQLDSSTLSYNGLDQRLQNGVERVVSRF